MLIKMKRGEVVGSTGRVRGVRAAFAVGLVLASASVAMVTVASPSGAVLPTPAPVREPMSSNVTADALPTTQIDGVVWSQAISGNTVYAGGDFAHARPAGAAAGTSQSPRTNLLAYDLTTGVLNKKFAPTLNGQVKVVALSPDKTRLYVGGSFTTVNKITRNHIAAFDTATGRLIGGFAPSINYTVAAIAATNHVVYAGGAFSAVANKPRSRLAAFSAGTGALLGWSPKADGTVLSMVLNPRATKVIIGGAFSSVNGAKVYGLTSIDANTGSVLPFAANATVHDYGSTAAFDSLSTDGTAVYGTGYKFGGSVGNFEGTFSANPDTGVLNWLEDCHGDTYGAFSTGRVVYTVSHSHYCGNVGGFSQSSPVVDHRALAWTATAEGTVTHNAVGGYHDFAGNRAPAQYNWYPDLTTGTFTNSHQAAWTVTGNSTYIALGGEFPSVNGVKQQGLVRFATRPIARGVQGPRVAATPTLTAPTTSSVQVSWQTSWDRDDENLTYRVIMDANTAVPVHVVGYTSQFWNRPTVSFTETGLTPGSSHRFRVIVSDPFGNSLSSSDVSITLGGVPANKALIAAFTQSCRVLTCTLNASGSSHPDGTVTSYAWNFGDGTAIVGGASPTHIYAAAGQYQVRLTITDTAGATSSVTGSAAVSTERVDNAVHVPPGGKLVGG